MKTVSTVFLCLFVAVLIGACGTEQKINCQPTSSDKTSGHLAMAAPFDFHVETNEGLTLLLAVLDGKKENIDTQFNGTVTLSSSIGEISPKAVDLIDGFAEAKVSIQDTQGDVNIMAKSDCGEATLSVTIGATLENRVTIDDLQTMTPDDILELSPEQADALGDEIASRLATFREENEVSAPEDQQLTTQQSKREGKWPGFYMADKLALGMGDNEYLKWRTGSLDGSIQWEPLVSYESYPSLNNTSFYNPDWTEDGCSVPLKKLSSALFFLAELKKEACIHHDFGYRNLSRFRQGFNRDYKDAIDGKFMVNMEDRCKDIELSLNPIKLFKAAAKSATIPLCYTQSLVFYGAVQRGGDDAFFKDGSDTTTKIDRYVRSQYGFRPEIAYFYTRKTLPNGNTIFSTEFDEGDQMYLKWGVVSYVGSGPETRLVGDTANNEKFFQEFEENEGTDFPSNRTVSVQLELTGTSSEEYSYQIRTENNYTKGIPNSISPAIPVLRAPELTHKVKVFSRPPNIVTFSANNETQEPQESNRLGWRIKGTRPTVYLYELSPNGEKKLLLRQDDGEGRDSFDINPTQTTTYILEAEMTDRTPNPSLTVSQQTPKEYLVTKQVTVKTLPDVVSFSALPLTIKEGQSSTLNWDIRSDTPVTVNIDNNIGVVTGTSAVVSPTQTTNYKLTATNTAGSVTRFVRVEVLPGDSNPVPLTVRILSPVVDEVDERGFNIVLFNFAEEVLTGQSSDETLELKWSASNTFDVAAQSFTNFKDVGVGNNLSWVPFDTFGNDIFGTNQSVWVMLRLTVTDNNGDEAIDEIVYYRAPD